MSSKALKALDDSKDKYENHSGEADGEYGRRLLSLSAGCDTTNVYGTGHSVVCTTEGVYTFGSGFSGRLGHGTFEDEKKPRYLSFNTQSGVVAVAAV